MVMPEDYELSDWAQGSEASVVISNNMEIMLADPTPFALTLPEGMVVGKIEDINSVETLPSQECKVEIAVVNPNRATDVKIDALQCLVVESHVK